MTDYPMLDDKLATLRHAIEGGVKADSMQALKLMELVDAIGEQFKSELSDAAAGAPAVDGLTTGAVEEEFLHPATQVYFRAGLLACREYMARFVEHDSQIIAASIRANWWPSLGQDFGAPRQLRWDEMTVGEYGEDDFRAKTADEVSPTQEALPIALQFLLSLDPGNSRRKSVTIDMGLEQSFIRGLSHAASEPKAQVTDEMVSRFLGLRLPDDFAPDCGVSFKPLGHPNGWPVGTNLFTAKQARAMLELVIAVQASEPKALTEAARDVLAERERQLNVEGCLPVIDDRYENGQLALVAGSYALACAYPHERDLGRGRIPPYWPWADSWWKPTTKRRNLVKAGALILAEVERIDRLAASDSNGGKS